MSKKRKCNTQKTVERKTGENDDGGQQPIPRKQRREKQRWHRKHQRARENKREKDNDRREFPRRRRAVFHLSHFLSPTVDDEEKHIFCSNPIDREWKRCPHLRRLLLPKSLKLRWCVWAMRILCARVLLRVLFYVVVVRSGNVSQIARGI